MSDYVITCSSTVDLSVERLEKRNIKWAPFHFQMDGIDYHDDYGRSMDLNEFYRRERAGATPTTSQVSVGEYLDMWKPLLEEGHDIFHAALSSGISGTYNSACIAAEDIRSLYPDRKIHVMDSLCASAGFGIFVEELADRRDEGMSFDELKVYAEEIKLNVNHWFFTSDLSCLIRGGRVSPAAGAVANILNICPLFKVNSEGKLVSVSKVRTKKKVYQEIVKVMSIHAENGDDYNGRCYISYSDCEEDANEVKKKIEATFPALRDKVELFRIGTTIGSHTGPATVALFFMGDERTV
ncbi:MAG: DegV family protein [Lachnospiraceae bacterium]|nr:DegV family protein [Lachnospiraceae bacterium]